MSHLTDCINRTAEANARKPRPLHKPGDIVWLFRKAAIVSADKPDADKLISRCYVVNDRSGGLYVHVLPEGENAPRADVGDPAFCARILYVAFPTKAEALEHVAELVNKQRQALERSAARWAAVYTALMSQLESELLPE